MVMRSTSSSTAMSIVAAAFVLLFGGCASDTAPSASAPSYSVVLPQISQPKLATKWVASNDALDDGATLTGTSSVVQLTNSIEGADRTFSCVRQQNSTCRVFYRKQVPSIDSKQLLAPVDVWIITVTDGWLLVTGDRPFAQGNKVLAASSGTTYLVRHETVGGVQVDRFYLNEGGDVMLYKVNPDGTFTSLNVSLTLDKPFVECRDGVVISGPRKLNPATASDSEFLAINRDAKAVGRSSGLTIP